MFLKYSDDQLSEFRKVQAKPPVEIPVNAQFHMKEVYSWKLRSVYESQHGVFHLHPELVDTDDSGHESFLFVQAAGKL